MLNLELQTFTVPAYITVKLTVYDSASKTHRPCYVIQFWDSYYLSHEHRIEAALLEKPLHTIVLQYPNAGEITSIIHTLLTEMLQAFGYEVSLIYETKHTRFYKVIKTE